MDSYVDERWGKKERGVDERISENLLLCYFLFSSEKKKGIWGENDDNLGKSG